MKKIVLTALFLLLAAPALAEGTSKPYALGGWFVDFDPVIARYNASGELFRIEGHCQSACTMFLSIRNVCIEPGARLLFHGGHNRKREITAFATNRILATYNAQLREYVVAQGWMNTLAFHTISGRDMIRKFGYRQCPPR